MTPRSSASCIFRSDRIRSAANSGANMKSVQHMLGHASAAMALDTHSDRFEDDLDAVATRLTSRTEAQASAPRGILPDKFSGMRRARARREADKRYYVAVAITVGPSTPWTCRQSDVEKSRASPEEAASGRRDGTHSHGRALGRWA